jgi:DNA-binding MarR family transcriptional regulator
MLPIEPDDRPPERPASPGAFGDVLALARLHWVREMSRRLDRLGYHDVRRSDAFVVRRLLRGPVPVGRLGEGLAITRQAARRVVDGLEQRGLATTVRDPSDARRLNVVLTPEGTRYARAVVDVVHALNGELAARVAPGDLEVAVSVLRSVVDGEWAGSGPGGDDPTGLTD